MEDALAGLRLAVSFGGGEEQRLDLSMAELSIGRSKTNDVVLEDPAVSRRHARLLVHHGRVLVEDLGSSTGTLVNGRKIRAENLAEILPGDRVSVGRATLWLVREDAEASTQCLPLDELQTAFHAPSPVPSREPSRQPAPGIHEALELLPEDAPPAASPVGERRAAPRGPALADQEPHMPRWLDGRVRGALRALRLLVILVFAGLVLAATASLAGLRISTRATACYAAANLGAYLCGLILLAMTCRGTPGRAASRWALACTLCGAAMLLGYPAWMASVLRPPFWVGVAMPWLVALALAGSFILLARTLCSLCLALGDFTYGRAFGGIMLGLAISLLLYAAGVGLAFVLSMDGAASVAARMSLAIAGLLNLRVFAAICVMVWRIPRRVREGWGPSSRVGELV